MLRTVAAALADTSRPILEGLLERAPEVLAVACATGARVEIGSCVVRLGVTPEEPWALPEIPR